jgi:serine/threonine protein kinase
LARLPLRVGDKFTLVRCLGRGGMGVVYQGRDLRLGRFVALKTLPILDHEAAEAMFDEARAMAAVEHPSLAQIFGVEIWRRTPVLVAEYLPNGTMASLLRDGPVEVARLFDIARALADALAALHDRGILHRDIKPSNIGFSRTNVPKLLDFGLARLIERSGRGDAAAPAIRADSPVSGTSTLAGTPLYLSPEAFAGAPPDVGRDLWALSVVLFEAVVGEHPFRAATVGDALALVQEGAVADPRRWRPDLPEGVAAFFRRALHVDPAHRYASARDLSAALDQFRQHPA